MQLQEKEDFTVGSVAMSRYRSTSDGRKRMKTILCKYCLSGSGFVLNYQGGLSCKTCGKENYRYDDDEEKRDFKRDGKYSSNGDLST